MARVETELLLDGKSKKVARPRTHVWALDPGWIPGYVTATKSMAENKAAGYEPGTRHAIHNHRRAAACNKGCVLVVVAETGMEPTDAT